MPSNVRLWLRKRAYKDRENLRLFSLGALAFFVGLGMVVLSNRLLLPSLSQEIISLVGLILAVAGGISAALGYLALSILRLLRLLEKND
ncbi:hypothetical protein ACQUQU_00415 [Thalassolituus sp. LLYu03]|uniref:hypothetical protein n=1 Tax=Thalassolituus sp. LLYu03 TaxID=3421656 RepID=UPI003D2E4E2E